MSDEHMDKVAEAARKAGRAAYAVPEPSADLSRLRDENARLREALEPFAAWASKEYPNRKATDTTIIWSVRGGCGSAEIVVGDFVRARAALKDPGHE